MAQQQQNRHFTANIPAPSKLDLQGHVETSWRKFKRQWQNYAVASRLDKEEKDYQCAVFLACIGEDALEVFDGLPFAEGENKEDIDLVIKKFEEFCIGTTCEAYESYKFHKREQETGENIDAYVAALRRAAKTCNFKEEERMIRDRVVIGIRDDSIRKKLLEVKDLDLQKAVQICRAQESTKTQMESMAQGERVSRLADTKLKNSQNIKEPREKQPQLHQQRPNRAADSTCYRCGRDRHNRSDCPAKSARCRKCSKLGHFAVVCRSAGQIHWTREEEEDLSDESYLGCVIGEVSDPWKVPIQLEGIPELDFKLDTGADVTVIPEKMIPKGKRPLERTKKKLYGPGKKEITVLGKFSTLMTYKGKTVTQDIYVIKDLEEPLLGRPAISALQLIEKVNAVSDKEAQYRREFPSLFSGLGNMTDAVYKIHLQKDCKPYAVTSPRRLALPLQDKVKEELDSLQRLGVIRPVTKPTDWCAPIVIVPKSNDRVRVCVDFTKLNEGVKRENFPLPSTDQLLAQLSGSTVFTKLDCNSGFHQIPLDTESQELTTFITPFGRFCYTRLPFGISSGPEIFQRTMTHLLAGVPGVICDMDDVLVHGKGQKQYDECLHEVRVMQD